MTDRKPISKKTRFEVFKRDSFACQYCGKKAPDVLLVIDHIEPVAKGGTNDILNLITSCRDCNSGKADRQLADTTVLDKQRQQLEDLQERKEQIEMMFRWQNGLLELDDHVTTQLSKFWSERVPGFNLNESGIKSLRRLKREFELDEIMTAMKIATEQYLEYVDGSPTKESVESAWKKVGGICTVRRRERENPEERRLYYIRGILKNRLSYLDGLRALQLLRDAVTASANLESLERYAQEVRSWTEWRRGMEDFIARQNQGEDEEAPQAQDGG
jgi:hypothetical protein